MNQSPDTKSVSQQLQQFLLNERDAILREWEKICREKLQCTHDLSQRDQRNNVPNILEAIAKQTEKKNRNQSLQQASRMHAEQRWRLGLSLEDVTREYGLLRRVILCKLLPRIGEISENDLVLLDEALDEAILEGVMTYVANSNKALEAERERLQVTLRSIGDGVIGTDARGRITYLNPAAEDIIGWPGEDAVGHPVDKVLIAVDQESRKELKSLTRRAAESGEPCYHSTEILLRQRNGELVPAEELAAPLWDSSENFLGVVTTFRDVSKIRALTMQLGYLAAHDPLTGLPNRSLLIERLTQEIAHAERHRNRLALLYLDLDLFKDVNDVLGHLAGDELLEQVGKRLQRCVRRTDTVCRVGGDEFVILMTEFEALEYLSELGAMITQQVRVPYDIGPDTVEISTSIGIAVYPEDGRDPRILMKHADIAMYQAKARGRNDVQFFAPEMNRRATERRELQSDLRNALAAKQLSLNFQPQIALSTGELIGAEALLRWRHHRLGPVPPSRFIPVAEDSREIMIAIGEWALEQACRQASIWRDAGHQSLPISVNVSVVQLRHERFLEHVKEVLERFQLPPEQLQLELTESLLMSDVAGASERVCALKDLGIRIAIDDFGTGYSSLSYLKHLPVGELKIDQSFVRNIESDGDNAPIVQAIIRMGQSLNLNVIAEGVEDPYAANFLTDNGCDGAQGYYYSKPITPGAFESQFLAHAYQPG